MDLSFSLKVASGRRIWISRLKCGGRRLTYRSTAQLVPSTYLIWCCRTLRRRTLNVANIHYVCEISKSILFILSIFVSVLIFWPVRYHKFMAVVRSWTCDIKGNELIFSREIARFVPIIHVRIHVPHRKSSQIGTKIILAHSCGPKGQQAIGL
jgi:hypothetical protein